MCDEKSKGLFPYAMELASRVIISEQVQDLDDEEDVRPEVSALVGAAQWSFCNFATATGVGGRDHGVRAIGVGSNSKARKRAARIALAVTVRLRCPALSCESPDGTPAFAQLVQRARRLFAGQGKTAPGRTFSGDLSSVVASLPMQGASGVSSLDSPEAAERTSLCPDQGAARSSSLQGKTVVALAAYEAEGGGYLPLKPGDRLVLKCEEPFPPDEQCKFLQYTYGVRVGGPSDGSGAPCDGWFPYDLITFP